MQPAHCSYQPREPTRLFAEEDVRSERISWERGMTVQTNKSSANFSKEKVF